MNKLRVVQWTTGKVGKLILRGILDDPWLKLVGVYAYSPTRRYRRQTAMWAPRHRRAGHHRHRRTAGTERRYLFYNPFMADLDHAVRLLESGLDVISTNLFLNVGGIQGDTRDKLTAACQAGNSSLYITGINPGWINTMVTAMTAICRAVTQVSIFESADVSVYESAETWQALGFSLPEASPDVLEMAKLWLSTFRDSVQRMAVALNYELDDMEFFIEHQTASEDVDLGWLNIKADTIAALRAGWNGKVHGRTVVQSNVAWYLTKKLNGEWVFDDDHYHVVITGEPEIQTRIRFIPPNTGETTSGTP